MTAWPVTGVGPVPGMAAFMIGEVTGFAKRLVTAWPVTGVGLVPGMDALVPGEVTGFAKRLVTAWPVADVGLFSGVDAPVHGEVTGLEKSLVTAWPVTGIGLDPGMAALVGGEVTGCGKSLVATRPVTGVGPLPGMAAHVNGEVIGFGKRLVAAWPVTGVGPSFAGFFPGAHSESVHFTDVCENALPVSRALILFIGGTGSIAIHCWEQRLKDWRRKGREEKVRRIVSTVIVGENKVIIRRVMNPCCGIRINPKVLCVCCSCEH